MFCSLTTESVTGYYVRQSHSHRARLDSFKLPLNLYSLHILFCSASDRRALTTGQHSPVSQTMSLFKSFFFLFASYEYMYGSEICVTVRGQLAGVGSLPLTCVSQGPQVLWEAPLPAVPAPSLK